MSSLEELMRGAPPVSDAVLFAASLDRPQLLAEIFDRHAPALLRYVTRRLGPDIAEDVLGDVFVVALERRGAFDPQAVSARPWLYGIASNVMARRYRDETRRLQAVERDGQAAAHRFEDTVAHRVDAERAVRRLSRALALLSPGDRDVLLMTAWAGLEQAEIAAALGIPVGTVKSRLHRARGRLRDDLGANELNEANGEADG